MQDWDRITFIALSLPIAAYQGYIGWRAWQGGKYDALFGAFLLGVATLVLPISLLVLVP